MHMENIAPLLKKLDPTNAGALAPASSTEDPAEQPQEEGLEGQGIKDQGIKDEELKVLKLLLLPTGNKKGMQKTLTQSYINWLHLMVAHFDAIEIVIYRECHGFVNLCGLMPRVPAGAGVGCEFVTLAQPVPMTRV